MDDMQDAAELARTRVADPPRPDGDPATRDNDRTGEHEAGSMAARPPEGQRRIHRHRIFRHRIHRHRIHRHRTWRQRIASVVLAATVAVGALWYAPGVLRSDSRFLTGTVTSSAVVSLNFTSTGEISRMDVSPGQAVSKGQVLAHEYAPDRHPVIVADRAAIAADQAKLARDARNGGQAAIDRAQLAADQARLATDQAKSVALEIIAPTAGVIVAANGQPGQVVTPSGIRDYPADTQRAPANQPPQFSLLPEGPQASQSQASASDLPVIALRTSGSWQVAALVPEGSVEQIKPGQRVTVSVPAAGLAGLPGRIGNVLPTPESTAQGTAYQVVVTVAAHVGTAPLNGMAADITLGP